FDLIVTCFEGTVFRIHGDGSVAGNAPIATLFPAGLDHSIEGPSVVPPILGPRGGEIWVADERGNAVHTIAPPPTYTVHLNLPPHITAEGIYYGPSTVVFAGTTGSLYLAEQQLTQQVWTYPLADFPPQLTDKAIITSEQGIAGSDTTVVSFDGVNYVQTS